MSLFGKIKSALKGNPVLKEYEVGKHICSAGPGLMWKVFNGVKKSTKQEASVFIFEKQSPEMEKVPKKRREMLFEMLKRGPAHLAKLRHPKLLTIQHQVEESNGSIAFATEPIQTCLANVLGFYENLPSPLPLAIKEYHLHPVEAHYGLLQIAEALDFLHTAANMLHGDLTPESILITSTGDWKLAGFHFACFVQYQTSAQTTFNFKEWDSQNNLHTNPTLDYLAPEYILTQKCGTYSDVYSFGMLCYAVFNGGRPLCESRNNTLTFKQNVEQISRVTETGLGDVPVEMRSLVRSLLVIEPSVRPDALQVTKHPFFNSVMIETLLYLDNLFEKSDMEKSQWFKKSLARVVLKLPKRVIHQRVLPALSNEFKNHKMIPFVLLIVLLIAEDCTIQEYTSLVLEILIPAFKIQDPIQVPLIFLQKMDLLLKKTHPESMKKHILPMILGSLESTNNQVQELCVSIIPTFADMVDYTSMKHSIVPRLTFLCINTPSVGLCVKCLVAMGQMLESLDRNIVIDQILPKVVQIHSREPGVLMGILGIYHKTMNTKNMELDKQYLATKALPFLIPLCLEPTLNPTQFQHFMVVMKEMLRKIETEQHAHLAQLSKMEEQTKSTVDFAREVAEAKAMDDTVQGIEDMVVGGGSTSRREEVLNSRLGTSVTPLKPTTTENSAIESLDLFSGLGLDSLQSSFSTPMPTLEPTPPTHGTTPIGGTTHSTGSGMMKIEFNEAKLTMPAMAQREPTTGSGSLLGSGALSLSPETPGSMLDPSGPSSLLQPSSVPISSPTIAEKKATPNPSMGWSPSIAGNSSASHGTRLGSSLTSGNVSGGSSALGVSGSLLQPQEQAQTGSGVQFAASGIGMNHVGVVAPQPLLQPQSRINSHYGSGIGMIQPQSGMSEKSGFGVDLLQPLSGISSQPGSQIGLMQPQSGMSSQSDSGMVLLQPQSGMSLQPGLGMGPSTANNTNSGMGLNTGSSLAMGLFSQPLQPSQPSSSYTSSSSSGMSWSSGITGQHQQTSATPPSSMGWSTAIAGQGSSYSSGLSSSGTNVFGGMPVGSSAPPTAASFMMGAAQPLTPQQQWQQQRSQLSYLQPAPGSNPFTYNTSLI